MIFRTFRFLFVPLCIACPIVRGSIVTAVDGTLSNGISCSHSGTGSSDCAYNMGAAYFQSDSTANYTRSDLFASGGTDVSVGIYSATALGKSFTNDWLVIYGPAGAGTLDMQLFGAATYSGNGYALVTFRVGNGNFQSGTQAGPFPTEVSVPFVFNQPIAITIDALAACSAADLDPRSETFSFTFPGIKVFRGGNQIDGFQFASSSGSDYPLMGGTFVPEPATYFTAIIALGFAFYACRKTSKIKHFR